MPPHPTITGPAPHPVVRMTVAELRDLLVSVEARKTKSASIPCHSRGEAMGLRARMNKARSMVRIEWRKGFDAQKALGLVREEERHSMHALDRLSFYVREGSDERWYVVIERGAASAAVEALADEICGIEPWKPEPEIPRADDAAVFGHDEPVF